MDKYIIRHKRYLIVIIFLLSMASFSISFSPKDIQGVTLFESLNDAIDGWSFVCDVKIDTKVVTTLNPQGLVFKTFRNKMNDEVALVIVYHHNHRWGAHDPNICYASQGWKFVGDENNIKMLKCHDQHFYVNEFEIQKGSNRQIVYYYWFSSNLITESREKQLFAMIINGILNDYTESGFVRISIDRKNLGDEDKAVDVLKDFTCKFNQVLKNAIFKEKREL